MHVNELRDLLPSGQTASQHRLYRAAVALGHTNDSETLISCEAPGCTTSVPVVQAFSIAAVYRMPGGVAPAFQCAEEQHFGCTHEHAMLAMMICLRDHIEPTFRQLQAAKAASLSGEKNGVTDG